MLRGTKTIGQELERRAFSLPNSIGDQIRSALTDFRQEVKVFQDPSIVQLHTLAYLIQNNRPDLVILFDEVAVLKPRHEIFFKHPRDRIVLQTERFYGHPISQHVENYVKKRIRISDVYMPDSAEQTTGQQLDPTTAGRLLLLKRIISNHYDPIYGLTRFDAEHCPTHLVSMPLRRLKRDLNVCGFHDMARRTDFLLKE